MSDLELLTLSDGTLQLRNTVFNVADNPLFFTTLSTGWLSGGVISVNAGDSAKVDVTAGSGIIVDASDPTNVTGTVVTWTAKTAVTLTHIATNAASFLAIDSDGDLAQSASFPVGGNLRTCIQLGGQTHSDNTAIENVSNFTSAASFQLAAAITDLQIAIGVVNVFGNVFSGSPLETEKFKKTAGESQYSGINLKNSPNVSPNNITDAELVDPQIGFVWRDGSGDFNTTLRDTIEFGVYDNNTGGTTNPTDSLSTNSWTNLRIKYSPDLAEAFMEWGQTSYNNSADAVAGLNSDTYAADISLAGVPVKHYLSIRGGGSDLKNSSDAIFTPTNKFGDL